MPRNIDVPTGRGGAITFKCYLKVRHDRIGQGGRAQKAVWEDSLKLKSASGTGRRFGLVLMDAVSELGSRPVDRCDALGAAPFSESEAFLSRPYLTASHRASLTRVEGWMAAAGMSVRLDPMANLIGRYEGVEPGAPALLIGSHIDTVPDGGRYDGALGIMLGIETVDVFNRQGKRFPFAIEVVAFGDEEGSRFPASMLCSRAIAGTVNGNVLDLTDESGLSLRDALAAFGLDPAHSGQAARKPGEIFAYIEAHIEQGPVLEAENLPIGVVTGVAAQLRMKGKFIGKAGHAGTTPMNLRADSIAAAAEGVMAVERICKSGPAELVGTVGRLISSTGAFNVIAGETEVFIDVRAPMAVVRDQAANAIEEAFHEIAKARGLGLQFARVQDLPGKPCDHRIQTLLGKAVEATGVNPRFLISGAGHDAMAIADLAPMGMLFIRCESGVSHNAAEKVAPEDVAYATRAMVAFVEMLAEEGL
jgi:allantoate deiminase